MKAAEKVGRDRDAQRGTLAALSRDIDAVKQREAALGGKARKRDGGLSRLSEDKAAVRWEGVRGLRLGLRLGRGAWVRVWSVGLGFWVIELGWGWELEFKVGGWC